MVSPYAVPFIGLCDRARKLAPSLCPVASSFSTSLHGSSQQNCFHVVSLRPRKRSYHCGMISRSFHVFGDASSVKRFSFRPLYIQLYSELYHVRLLREQFPLCHARDRLETLKLSYCLLKDVSVGVVTAHERKASAFTRILGRK